MHSDEQPPASWVMVATMARVKKTPEALAFVIICFGQEVTHVTSAYNSVGLAQTQVNLGFGKWTAPLPPHTQMEYQIWVDSDFFYGIFREKNNFGGAHPKMKVFQKSH